MRTISGLALSSYMYHNVPYRLYYYKRLVGEAMASMNLYPHGKCLTSFVHNQVKLPQYYSCSIFATSAYLDSHCKYVGGIIVQQPTHAQ